MTQPGASLTVSEFDEQALATPTGGGVVEVAVAAIRTGDAEALRALLAAHGPGFAKELTKEQRFGEQDTPLNIAARLGRLECLQILLPHSDPTARNDCQRTALHLAASQGHADCVEALLPVSDPNAQNQFDATALMEASKNHHAACVRLLLPVTDLNITEEQDGQTALALAAGAAASERGEAARVECLEILLARAPEMREEDLIKALHRAIDSGSGPALTVLLPHASLSETNVLGLTPLMAAAEKGRLECAQILLDAGADPSQRAPSRGETALMFAAHGGSVECVKLLLPVSDPNAECAYGQTALHYAAARGRSECVSVLLPLTAEDAVRRSVEEQISTCRESPNAAGAPSVLSRLDRFLVQLSEHNVAIAPELQAIAFEALGEAALPRAGAVACERELSLAVKDAERAAEARASGEATNSAAPGERSRQASSTAPARAPARRASRRM